MAELCVTGHSADSWPVKLRRFPAFEGMQPTFRQVPPRVGFFSTHTVCTRGKRTLTQTTAPSAARVRDQTRRDFCDILVIKLHKLSKWIICYARIPQDGHLPWSRAVQLWWRRRSRPDRNPPLWRLHRLQQRPHDNVHRQNCFNCLCCDNFSIQDLFF